MDTELWCTADGVEATVTKWTEVLEIVNLGGSSMEEDEQAWRTKPHFVIKLSHRYILESLNHMKRFWDWKHGSSLQYSIRSFFDKEILVGNMMSKNEEELRALKPFRDLHNQSL
jgi:hypothetical protein